ncbi:LacI family DNA-binding transcriptional regulator [Microbacterium awajiense]|uniref:LacI family DNA-binding transcriptional regulator n=1 Tax=Microbacterium awajiense TaxID=415214 RepID=A0ABP7AU70_9MICO
MSDAPRLRDVAERAGVSVSLVSSFINSPEKVGAASGDRISRAIAELKFVPNDAARRLRRGQSRMVAFVAYDIADPNFALIARGAQARAAEAGLQVVLADTAGVARTERDYIAMFEEQRVRGVLLSPAQHPEEYLHSLQTRGIPAVLVDHQPPAAGWPSVAVDNYAGGRLAARHLLATGRRDLVVLGGDESIPQVAERLRGATDAVAEAPGARLRFITSETRDTAAGRELAQVLLDEGGLPDAAFCINDLIALGLMQKLSSTGVQVPDTVAVIGYNDIAADASGLTSLSSVRQPHEEFGRTAVELLIEALNGAAPRQVVFSPELIVRESSRGSMPSSGSERV